MSFPASVPGVLDPACTLETLGDPCGEKKRIPGPKWIPDQVDQHSWDGPLVCIFKCSG